MLTWHNLVSPILTLIVLYPSDFALKRVFPDMNNKEKNSNLQKIAC